MGEPFRPVAPVDPTNLRPMLFLDVAPQGFRRALIEQARYPSLPADVPAAAEVWRQQGYL